MYQRHIATTLSAHLFQGRVITLFGARRVGKTTLAQAILDSYPDKRTRFLNCDLQSVRQGLSVQEAEPLKAFLGEQDLVVLDEAQNIPEVGRVLKILVDTYPEMQVIATGSSSFDLANRTGEALTGRVYPFILYPLSLGELAGGNGISEIEPRLEHLLRFGAYPSIVDRSEAAAKRELDELVSHYLYKDVLSYIGVKRSSAITSLLRLLSLQLGHEVSYTELGTRIGIDRKTVMSYIDVLEQCFVIFRLGAFSRNLRNEISRSQKIYFYDVGVRNALLRAFSPLSLRSDVGAIWENLCIAERIKLTTYRGEYVNRYFWRTYTQKEIDYIEEADGVLTGFECKWNPERRMRNPQEFLDAYPGSSVVQVDRSNYWRYLL